MPNGPKASPIARSTTKRKWRRPRTGEPLPNPHDQLRTSADPQRRLGEFVDQQYLRFSMDTRNSLPVFWAISQIAGFYFAGREPGPTDRVWVPWWVIRAIANGFLTYHAAHLDGRTTTLGEVFNLEGGGQGKEPKVRTMLRRERDQWIALDIALQVTAGQKVTQAIGKAAAKYRVSDETAYRIWGRLKNRATTIVARYGPVIASRSDDRDK